jgi:hypothetical protein
MAAELRQLIQKEDTVVGQQHLPRQRHLAPADQAHVGDRLAGGAEKSFIEVSEASALAPI